MRPLKRLDRQTTRIYLMSVSIGFGLILFTYIAVQQSLRLGLNAPQLQIAQDTAAKLSAGANPKSVLPSAMVDESKSLAPFVTIVDKNIRVLASSGNIDGIIPLPPASVFPGSQIRKSSWFTWQHDSNSVRDAAVIVPYDGSHPGYVLVARSMGQAEDTISRIALLAGLTLLGVLIVPLIILLLI